MFWLVTGYQLQLQSNLNIKFFAIYQLMFYQQMNHSYIFQKLFKFNVEQTKPTIKLNFIKMSNEVRQISFASHKIVSKMIAIEPFYIFIFKIVICSCESFYGVHRKVMIWLNA